MGLLPHKPAPVCMPLTRSAPPRSLSYKNKENIDLSSLSKFAKHSNDVGGTEVQLAKITLRVAQIAAHLATNKKDNSCKRGLQALLAQRKSLLQYLYRENRWVGGLPAALAISGGCNRVLESNA